MKRVSGRSDSIFKDLQVELCTRAAAREEAPARGVGVVVQGAQARVVLLRSQPLQGLLEPLAGVDGAGLLAAWSASSRSGVKYLRTSG